MEKSCISRNYIVVGFAVVAVYPAYRSEKRRGDALVKSRFIFFSGIRDGENSNGTVFSSFAGSKSPPAKEIQQRSPCSRVDYSCCDFIDFIGA